MTAATADASIRRRINFTAPPRRCSSAVSIKSVYSSDDENIEKDRDDITITCYDEQHSTSSHLGRAISIRNFFSFDSLNLQSTAWRNAQMKKAVVGTEVEQISHIQHFGTEVCFIPDTYHYTAKELEPYRQIGDPEMDALLEDLSKNKNRECGCGAFDDVIAFAKQTYEKDTTTPSSPAREFYKHYHDHVPEWVDFEQIQRGIDVFLAYLPAAGMALFYRSLVGGFSIPKIVEVLVATRYLVPSNMMSTSGDRGSTRRSESTLQQDRKRSMERLFDTGGFLACCFAPLASTDSGSNSQTAASLRPGGKGWESALQVRVLHAKVRRSLLQSKNIDRYGQSTPRWDSKANGVPINQEDMAATLLAFSSNVLLGIEIMAGQPLPESEQRDYLALWRYIGWLLGVDTAELEAGAFESPSDASKNYPLVPIDPCGPRKLTKLDEGQLRSLSADQLEDILPAEDPLIHSYATLESMILHLLHPEQSSRQLVSHLMNLRSQVTFRSEVCRKLLGDPLSDELGIGRSTIQWQGWTLKTLNNFLSHVCVTFFVYLFLFFLRGYTLLPIMFPRVRRYFISWHGRQWRKVLSTWEKMHAKRMTSAQAKASNSKSAAKRNESHCPFSMIMSPDSTS